MLDPGDSKSSSSDTLCNETTGNQESASFLFWKKCFLFFHIIVRRKKTDRFGKKFPSFPRAPSKSPHPWATQESAGPEWTPPGHGKRPQKEARSWAEERTLPASQNRETSFLMPSIKKKKARVCTKQMPTELIRNHLAFYLLFEKKVTVWSTCMLRDSIIANIM